jgi:predicted TIM-barrel fold metal-dependent hydrolase
VEAVFDAHLHFFSRTYFESLAAKAPGEGSVAEKVARFARTTGVEIPADVPSHVMRWLAALDEHGVDRSVVFSSSPEEVGDVSQAALLASGRFVPVALVDPSAPDAPAKTRTLLDRAGYRGVLLFPALHRVRMGSPETRAVVAEVAAAHGVVYVQCGMLRVPARDAFGLPRQVDLSLANPLDLVPLADAFPETPFVVPHLGAGMLRETLMAGAQCPNVFVDTSSSNSWVATDPALGSLADAFRKAIGVFGADRILFGTDSTTFPRGWRADLRLAQIRAFGEAGLPRDAFAKVFHENASRIFGFLG